MLIKELIMFSNDYKKVRAEVDERGKGKTQCEQLDVLREAFVHLDQVRNTYWHRPCLRDWPCLFTAHHYEIDKLKEQLSPYLRRLERGCEVETTVQTYRETIGTLSENKNTNINNNGGQVLHNPTITLPKPHV